MWFRRFSRLLTPLLLFLLSLRLLKPAQAGETTVWAQCGGTSGCNGDSCGDATWPFVSCPSAASCVRVNEYYWQCTPNSLPAWRAEGNASLDLAGEYQQQQEIIEQTMHVHEAIVPLGPWSQCGGINGCPNPQLCADAPWSGLSCPSGYTCIRQDQYYYQCKRDDTVPDFAPPPSFPSPPTSPSSSPSPSPSPSPGLLLQPSPTPAPTPPPLLEVPLPPQSPIPTLNKEPNAAGNATSVEPTMLPKASPSPSPEPQTSPSPASPLLPPSRPPATPPPSNVTRAAEGVTPEEEVPVGPEDQAAKNAANATKTAVPPATKPPAAAAAGDKETAAVGDNATAAAEPEQKLEPVTLTLTWPGPSEKVMSEYAPPATRALANITSLPLANITAAPLPTSSSGRRRRLQEDPQTVVLFTLVSADRNKTVRDLYRSIASNGIYDALRAQGLTVMPSSIEITGQDSPEARLREVSLTSPAEPPGKNNSSYVGKLVGIIVGSVLGFLLLCALVYVVLHYRRNRRRREDAVRVDTPGKLREKYSASPADSGATTSSKSGAPSASPTRVNVQEVTRRSQSSEEKVEDWISSSGKGPELKADVELGRYDQATSSFKGNFTTTTAFATVGTTTAAAGAATAATAALGSKKPPTAPGTKPSVLSTAAANAPVPGSPFISPGTPQTPALYPLGAPTVSSEVTVSEPSDASFPKASVLLPADTSFKSAEAAGEVAARLTPTRNPGGQAITAAGLPKPALLSSSGTMGAPVTATPAAVEKPAWKPPSAAPGIPLLDRTDSGGGVLSASRSQPRAALGFLTPKILGASGPGSQQWSGKALTAPPPLPPPPKDEPQTAAAKYAARQAALAQQQDKEEEDFYSGEQVFGTPKSEVSTGSDFSWVTGRSEVGAATTAGAARPSRASPEGPESLTSGQ